MNEKTKQLLNLLNEKHAEALANFAIDIWANNNNNIPHLLDYDFKINRGVMANASAKKANTTFSFDFPNNHFGKNIVQLLGDEEVDADLCRIPLADFLSLVKKCIHQYPSMKEIITSSVLGDGPVIKDFEVKDIYISDLPTIDWTITINKSVELGSDIQPIAAEVMNNFLLTGEEPEAFIARKQQEGNKNYLPVIGIQRKKCFFECDIILWVNYSM